MRHRMIVLTTATLFAFVWALQAGDDEKGFTSLFNGKDLTGWVYPKKGGDALEGKSATLDQRVEVKDGAIVMNAKDAKGKGGIKDLYTAQEFGNDFVLEVAVPRWSEG